MNKLTQNKPLVIMTFASSALLLSSCSGFNSPFKLPDHKIDYKDSRSIKSLEVPPDLSTPEYDSEYTVTAGDTVSAAAYNRHDGSSASGVKVLPSLQSKGLQIKRAGNVSWLEVQAPADALWPKLTAFWGSIGVAIKSNEPRIGVMETEWSENRAGLPKDWLRKALGKVMQDTYDAGTRDKYRLRVERPSAGITNVFVSHRRAEEVVAAGGGVKWEMRPADSGLEAEVLSRLSSFLQGGAKVVAPGAKQVVTPVSWSSAQGVPVLVVAEDRKRTWLRVGVMLERIGMSIEGQERDNGVYKVVYHGGGSGAGKRGWFSKIFKGSKDVLSKGGEYQIHLSDSGSSTTIVVADVDGQSVSNEVSRDILGKLKLEFER